MSTTNPPPNLNIHSQSPTFVKDFYRRQHNFKLPRAKLPRKWITDEFDRQDVWNKGAGVDVDFVVEEYRRCHPDLHPEHEEGMEFILHGLVQEKKMLMGSEGEGRGTVADWGFAEQWFKHAHPAVDR
ncbi:hypothetical protein FKW77_003703 [Venturia effusa]|uniref:Uncharacterized protein n=1 Tax=Venturia effusa TaxID=50376 RepID=A0A517LPW4_9PEZI|nr:hypothetical protein FKW77_003703 [Venturia effusa]